MEDIERLRIQPKQITKHRAEALKKQLPVEAVEEEGVHKEEEEGRGVAVARNRGLLRMCVLIWELCRETWSKTKGLLMKRQYCSKFV